MDHDTSVVSQLATLIEQGKWIKEKITALEKEVKDLTAFKWRMIGIGSAMGAIGAIIFEAIKDAVSK